MCERGGETERNFIVHFRECFGRPVTAPRSRCGLEISGATKRMYARRETSVIQWEFLLDYQPRDHEIVNVSLRDDIRGQI